MSVEPDADGARLEAQGVLIGELLRRRERARDVPRVDVRHALAEHDPRMERKLVVGRAEIEAVVERHARRRALPAVLLACDFFSIESLRRLMDFSSSASVSTRSARIFAAFDMRSLYCWSVMTPLSFSVFRISPSIVCLFLSSSASFVPGANPNDPSGPNDQRNGEQNGGEAGQQHARAILGVSSGKRQPRRRGDDRRDSSGPWGGKRARRRSKAKRGPGSDRPRPRRGARRAARRFVRSTGNPMNPRTAPQDAAAADLERALERALAGSDSRRATRSR